MVPRMVERRVGLEETVLPIGYHETGMTSRAPERKRLRKPLTCANTSGPRRARTDDLRIKSVTPMRFPHSTPQARDQPERPNPQQPQRYCRLARTNRHQPTTTPADKPPEPLQGCRTGACWRGLLAASGQSRNRCTVIRETINDTLTRGGLTVENVAPHSRCMTSGPL